MDKPKISKGALYRIMSGMLAFSTCNTLIMKIQGNTQKPTGYYFTHPYL
jgi:hypothetical protein